MKAEAIRRRADIHSALGDPARLTIADLLAAGDASPSELQSLLGMPSNLLAHHLRRLEQVGLVTRGRSEHDRRRTYLRLIPAGLAGLLPGPHLPAARIVFVCTGNSARSQLAAALWRSSSTVPAESAGTRPAARIHPGTVAAAHRHGLPLHPTRPRSLDGVLRPGDLVITVCDSAHEQVGAAARWVHWSVPDPVPAADDAAFDRVLHQLTDRVGRLRPLVRTDAQE